MLTEKQIIKKLRDYGHLGPHLEGIPELKNAADVKPSESLSKLKITDTPVKEALASFQGFMAQDMERLSIEMRKAPSGMITDSGKLREFGDGEFDDVVRALFEVPRCGMPDLGLEGFAASGSWQLPCRTEGVTFYVDKSGMPSSYAEFWDNEILPEVIEAYRLVGARMKQIAEKAIANIFNSFPSLPGSTIGLATLHAGSCSSKGFCRLDRGFRCTKEEAKELLCHEWGHNWNHNHTRSGIMSPSIGRVDKFNGWLNDPAMSSWIRFTDGKPLPPLNPPKPLSPDDFYTGI